MKLEKAIAILTRHLDYPFEVNTTSLQVATKLGIEALKAIKCGREGLRTEFHTLLLGETED